MINYPNKIKKRTTNNNNSVNASATLKGQLKKGMDLEELLNQSNMYYADNNKAFIYKKPTPIKVNKVRVKNEFGRKTHQITEAYYSEKSTTDYSGLYLGKYIDFEAKQTKYKSFNIGANLHQHQINHLQNISEHGGYAYVIVYFYQLEEIIIINFDKILPFIKENKTLIPFEYFKENGNTIELEYNPPLDYIKFIKRDIES